AALQQAELGIAVAQQVAGDVVAVGPERTAGDADGRRAGRQPGLPAVLRRRRGDVVGGDVAGGDVVDVLGEHADVGRAEPRDIVPARRVHPGRARLARVVAVAVGREGRRAGADVEEGRRVLAGVETDAVQRGIGEAVGVLAVVGRRRGRLDARPHAHPQRRGEAGAAALEVRLAAEGDGVAVALEVTRLGGDVGDAAAWRRRAVRSAVGLRDARLVVEEGDPALVAGLRDVEGVAAAGEVPGVLLRARRVGGGRRGGAGRGVEHRAADGDDVRAGGRVAGLRVRLVEHAVAGADHGGDDDGAGGARVTGRGEERLAQQGGLLQRVLRGLGEHHAGGAGEPAEAATRLGRIARRRRRRVLL